MAGARLTLEAMYRAAQRRVSWLISAERLREAGR
jgi:hypothetical protein